MNSCKRNLRTVEKSLFTSKDLNSNKRKLKISRDNMMISVPSTMKEFSNKNKNTSKNCKRQSWGWTSRRSKPNRSTNKRERLSRNKKVPIWNKSLKSKRRKLFLTKNTKMLRAREKRSEWSIRARLISLKSSWPLHLIKSTRIEKCLFKRMKDSRLLFKKWKENSQKFSLLMKEIRLFGMVNSNSSNNKKSKPNKTCKKPLESSRWLLSNCKREDLLIEIRLRIPRILSWIPLSKNTNSNWRINLNKIKDLVLSSMRRLSTLKRRTDNSKTDSN